MFMRFLKREKQPVVIETPPEIIDSKRQMQQASNAATINTKKLKKILVADHVTLRIQVATHGGKHA